MIFCNKCGKENQDFTKFCTGCGNNILTAISTSPAKDEQINPVINDMISNELICSQCGKQNKQNTKFCISCGNGLTILPQQKEINSISETSIKENLCSKCGKQNKESTKFCIVCGNNLSLFKEGFQANSQNVIDSRESRIELNIPFSEKIKSVNEDINDSNITFSENKTAENYNEHGLKTNQQIGYIKNEEIALVQGGSNEISDPLLQTEESYSPPNQNKRKKIIYLKVSIFVLAGLGLLFLFGNVYNLFSTKKISDMQQDIKPKEEPKTTAGIIPPIKDSIIPKSNFFDSAKPILLKNITFKPADSIISIPVLKNTTKIVSIETPAPPTLQMAINDLTGHGISKDVVFTKNTKVLSYNISKKTLQQCNVIIAFKLENSDVKYTATLIYKNNGDGYIYENNTSSFKTLPAKEKNPSSPYTTSAEHNVKNDLINYLNTKKIFNGIKYNDISEIVIKNVHNKEYYAEYGNTSYQVEFTINNISSKCQVNYTIDRKFYVNPLR